MFIARTISDLPVVVLIHNCLLSQGGPFNLLSVSHFQASRQNSVDFNSDSPNLTVTSPTGHAMFLLDAQDGLYSFLAEPIHPSDDRYRSLPRFDLTSPDGLHGGAPTVALLRSSSSLLSAPVLSPTPLGRWSCRVLLGSTLQHRILAFPMAAVSDFDSELRPFCNDFLSPVASAPARRTYDSGNPLHMADLSTRFMGIGDERLRRTIELNRGLSPAAGRVPVHPFPQGKFKQGKTPRVNKGKVHHLARAYL